MVHLVSLIVCVAGLVLYVVATRAEAKELGRLSFACGLLVVLWRLAGPVIG